MDLRPAATAFPDWPQYAARIARVVGALQPEQLALRASPDHAPVWALAAHVASSRIYWLCVVCGEPGLETSTVVDPATGEGWEDDPERPRSSGELVGALDASWAVVAGCLERWTPAMLAEEVERRYGEAVQHHRRISILNRLFSHDAFHAGEISQLLGVAGLPAIDLWRPDAPA
jgi:hypothetical protein